jgi:hypothetical protein
MMRWKFLKYINIIQFLVKKLTTRVSYYKDYNDSIVERIKFIALKWGKINSIKIFFFKDFAS